MGDIDIISTPFLGVFYRDVITSVDVSPRHGYLISGNHVDIV